MSKRNGETIHVGTLQPSTPDTVALAQAVEERFLQLCNQYRQVKGNVLVFPESMDRDVMRWRMMRVRHRSGDFRNSEAELRSVQAIAQWSLDIKKDICGKERVKLVWS